MEDKAVMAALLLLLDGMCASLYPENSPDRAQHAEDGLDLGCDLIGVEWHTHDFALLLHYSGQHSKFWPCKLIGVEWHTHDFALLLLHSGQHSKFWPCKLIGVVWHTHGSAFLLHYSGQRSKFWPCSPFCVLHWSMAGHSSKGNVDP